jgi:hypothetical protein
MSGFTEAAYNNAVDYATTFTDIINNTILPPLKKKYISLQCDLIRLDKLKYNCVLRRNEGYMINKSLADLRNDIQVLIKKSLQKTAKDRTTYNPIFYEKYIFPYCRNINLNDEYFDFFLKEEKNNDTGILVELMSNPESHPTIEGFGIDLNKINFGVFTVINLTNKLAAPFVNNPPNPPYINLNDVVTHTLISPNETKMTKSGKELLNKLNKYTFYSSITNTDPLSVLSRQPNLDDMKKVINLIKSNNAATLIGSLEGTEILQNTAYTKLICSYNKNGVSEMAKFIPQDAKYPVPLNDIFNE